MVFLTSAVPTGDAGVYIGLVVVAIAIALTVVITVIGKKQ